MYVKEIEETDPRKCHWGNTFAFQWEGLKFFGAGSFRGLNIGDMDVIIDCGANVPEDTDTGKKAGAPSSVQRVIRIDWPDGGVPDLTEGNWRAIIRDLKMLKSGSGREFLNVLVCCVGGHGRTGTALSIIAALTGVAPDAPVLFIRSGYCRKAVETRAQCGYIRKIANITDDDLPLPDFDISCEASLR